MKLLSFQEIFSETLRTIQRFPFVIITTLLGVVSALILIDYEGPPGTSILFNILYVSLPGIPLFLAIALTAERRKWKIWFTLGMQSAGIIALAAYGFVLPSYMIDTPAAEFFRLMVLTAAMCFLATYAPFSSEGNTNGFWHYNKILFFRILLSFLYSTVLFTGLILALLAVNNLFSIDIQPKRYGELAVLIYGLFNTLIVLRGIPEDLDALDSITEYPKGLKIFVQYILLPIAAVYLLIIYAYAFKILFSWTWPQGWISRMILGYSLTGFLSLLFLYPIHAKDEYRWMRTVFRSFFISMIPLVVLFPLALFRRISQYGITESRYFAVVLALWLPLMLVYFVFSKKKSIKAFPVTMLFISMLISVGPWNMFAVSEYSQFRRLESILKQAGILIDGKVQQPSVTVSSDEKINISSIVSYLHDMHGYGMIRPWFTEDLYGPETGSIKTNLPPDGVVKKLGVEFVNVWQGGSSNTMMLNTGQDAALNIEGYRTLIRTQFIDKNMKGKQYPDLHISYSVSHDLDSLTILSEKGISADTVRFDLKAFAVRMNQEFGDIHLGNITQDKMTMTGNGKHITAKLFFRFLQTQRTDGNIHITSCGFDIAYSDK